MTDLLISVLEDLGAATGVPGSSVLSASIGNVLQSYKRRKAAQAREIVLEEMAQGTLHAFDVAKGDESIAVALRYARAAFEGTARLNLRLLAKVVAGQAVSGSIYAPEFHEFANDLEDLTIAEVVFLGTLVKLTEEAPELPKSDESGERYEVAQSVGILMRKSLVGTEHFESRESFDACSLALQRTRLVFDTMHLFDGQTILGPSPRLIRLKNLSTFRTPFDERVFRFRGRSCSGMSQIANDFIEA